MHHLYLYRHDVLSGDFGACRSTIGAGLIQLPALTVDTESDDH